MFKKAKRTRAKLKLAITGPSGSGKTYSALSLATGLGGKIAVIDTENGSASLYSDRFDFDVTEIGPPYTVEKFIQAIKTAEEAGYDILIIDSISHQWRGEGGILNKKEQLDARGGNSFTNWAKLTPEQERFMAAILHSQIHTICTLRSKQEYAVVDGEKGRTKVQKLGLAPIQRDGMEYEFTTVLDVAMNHEAEASKDRTGLFADRIFKIEEKTGQELRAWLEGADEVEPPRVPATTAPTTPGKKTWAELKTDLDFPVDEKLISDPGSHRINFGSVYFDKNTGHGLTIAEAIARDGEEAFVEWLHVLQDYGEKSDLKRTQPAHQIVIDKYLVLRYRNERKIQDLATYMDNLSEEEHAQIESMIDELRITGRVPYTERDARERRERGV